MNLGTATVIRGALATGGLIAVVVLCRLCRKDKAAWSDFNDPDEIAW